MTTTIFRDDVQGQLQLDNAPLLGINFKVQGDKGFGLVCPTCGRDGSIVQANGDVSSPNKERSVNKTGARIR